MGYIRHEAVIAVLFAHDEPENAELEALRADMTRGADEDGNSCDYGRFLLGPAKGVNGYTTWVFAPDGSKEGWDFSRRMDKYRERFIAIVKKSRYSDVVHLQLGGDDRETIILDSTDCEARVLPGAVAADDNEE